MNSAPKYKVRRADRAAVPLQVGQIVYSSGYDSYGLKNDDTRRFGIEYESFSLNESGKPVFTMPLEDVVRVLPHPERVTERQCSICHRPLNDADPFAVDCGGDCLNCMAVAGDPDAITYLKQRGLVPQVTPPEPQTEATPRPLDISGISARLAAYRRGSRYPSLADAAANDVEALLDTYSSAAAQIATLQAERDQLQEMLTAAIKLPNSAREVALEKALKPFAHCRNGDDRVQGCGVCNGCAARAALGEQNGKS